MALHHRLAGFCAALLLVLTTATAIAQVGPLEPSSKPQSRETARQAISAVKNKLAAGKWTITKEADGSTTYRPDGFGYGEEHATYVEKSDGTIVVRFVTSRISYVVTYPPSGGILKEWHTRDNIEREVTGSTLWRSDGSITVSQNETRLKGDDKGTTIATETNIKPNGASETTETTVKPDGTSTARSGSTPATTAGKPAQTATAPGTAPTQPPPPATAPSKSATSPSPTPGGSGAPGASGSPPAGTTAPPAPSPGGTSVPAPSGLFFRTATETSPFYVGFDGFAMGQHRVITFTNSSPLLPTSSSRIDHRSTELALMLNASYEMPVRFANMSSEIAFGGRVGGFVTGGHSTEDFGSRVSTGNSWVVNPYVQYRPSFANALEFYFETGVWIGESCFSERNLTFDTRDRFHGVNAAPELGIGISAPLPLANVGNMHVNLGLHWIGPASIERTENFGFFDQTIKVERRGTIAGRFGLGFNF